MPPNFPGSTWGTTSEGMATDWRERSLFHPPSGPPASAAQVPTQYVLVPINRPPPPPPHQGWVLVPTVPHLLPFPHQHAPAAAPPVAPPPPPTPPSPPPEQSMALAPFVAPQCRGSQQQAAAAVGQPDRLVTAREKHRLNEQRRRAERNALFEELVRMVPAADREQFQGGQIREVVAELQALMRGNDAMSRALSLMEEE